MYCGSCKEYVIIHIDEKNLRDYKCIKCHSRLEQVLDNWFLKTQLFLDSCIKILLYYFLYDPAILDIFSSIKINPPFNPIVYTLLDSNLQFGGVFFAIVFLVIAKKIPKGHQIVNSLIISLIRMMFIFGSKDISTIILPSYPPVGIVAISFMGLASYLLLVGIYSSATIVARDITLRKYLNKKVENDTTLLNNIAYAENESEIEKNVKSLINYSSQWQQENIQLEMNQQEIKEIIDDVIYEVKENIMKNNKIK